MTTSIVQRVRDTLNQGRDVLLVVPSLGFAKKYGFDDANLLEVSLKSIDRARGYSYDELIIHPKVKILDQKQMDVLLVGKRKSSKRSDSSVVKGYVRWPIDDPEYPHTGEGGMFVRLVVIDPKVLPNGGDFYERWIPSTGGYHHVHLDECFCGDDEGRKDFFYENEKEPYFTRSGPRGEGPHMTFSLLATLVIGATGWSNGNWNCTFNDLTAEGLLLVSAIRDLYPGCAVKLLTFLDT